MTRPARSVKNYTHTHRGTHSSLSLKSVYCFVRSQTELLMGQMIATWQGRGSGSRGSHHFPSAKGVPLFNVYYVNYVTPKTHPWAQITLHPDYLLFNSQNGLGHALNALAHFALGHAL